MHFFKDLQMKWVGFAARSALFLIELLLILYFVNIWSSQKFIFQDGFRYSELFHPRVNADLIILGDSKTESGVHPKILEDLVPGVYNFSMSGTGPIYHRDFYIKFLRTYYPKPKIVVYGVRPNMLNEGAYRTLEHDSEYFPRRIFLRELFDRNISLKTMLLNRFSILKHRGEDIVQPFVHGGYIPDKFYKGYVPMVHDRVGEGNQGTARSDQVKISATGLKSLQELIEALKADHVYIVLVQLPTLKRKSLLPESCIENVAEKYSIPYLNYNQEKETTFNTNEECFHDAEHLSEEGSLRFSNLLRKDLAELLLREYQNLYAKNPDFENTLEMGNLYFVKENYPLALDYYGKARDMSPNEAMPYYRIGKVLGNKKDWPHALFNYQKALALDPEFSDAYESMSDAYCSAGDFSSALHTLEKWIDLEPDNADAFEIKGDLLHNNLKDAKSALDCYKRVLELRPGKEIFNKLGILYLELNDKIRAFEMFCKSHEITNDASPENYYNFGSVYQTNMKDYDKALEYYDKAVRINPNNERAWYNSGVIFYDIKNDYASAANAFENVLILDPNYRECYKILASSYHNMKQIAKAIDVSKKALQLMPDDPLLKQGLSQLISELNGAPQYTTDQLVDSYIQSGGMYLYTRKDFSKALEFYQKAIRLKDHLPKTVYYNVGTIFLMKLKNPTQSIPFYQKAISLDSHYSDAYLNLGNAYLQLKENQKALLCYQKVLKLNPDDPDIHQTIATAKVLMEHPEIQVNLKLR